MSLLRKTQHKIKKLGKKNFLSEQCTGRYCICTRTGSQICFSLPADFVAAFFSLWSSYSDVVIELFVVYHVVAQSIGQYKLPYFSLCSSMNDNGRKKTVFRIRISFMRIRIQNPENIHTYPDPDAMRILIRIQGGYH